jgi:NADH-quinone oxidoreductase subunit G
MSTPANNPPSDTVNIEIDGKPCKARKGSMIIEHTDALGAYVPRFCYHPKLTIAANCRMCLVEVEKAPKPLPACATPVMEGMKVSTASPKALAAQKATMEFLLINHPLDCPICDQGGECELQDLAMGYGRGASRFTEQKRVVADQDIGPLISTDMTRCIHCTRCVRFGSEVAGQPELGATGRGENMRIGTYIAKSVDHELSGNVIDLCPVGALNSKPFRMRGRSWEMQQHAQVSPHDALGGNLWAHTLRGKLLRVVPRANDEINECWASDRDRFGYEGLHAADRLLKPMVKRDGAWHEVGWEQALETAAAALRGAGGALGALFGAGSTLEEFHLGQKLVRGLGSEDLDHRLGQSDFRDGAAAPAPVLGRAIAELESLAGVLAVGLDLRKDAPLLGHRIRKAALKGAKVAAIGPRAQTLRFAAVQQAVDEPGAVRALAKVLAAVAERTGRAVPAHLAAAAKAGADDQAKALAAALVGADVEKGQRAVVLGPWAEQHPRAADLRALAAAIAELSGASFGLLPHGANAVGAHLAGFLPHAGPGGAARPTAGRDARAMLGAGHRAFLVAGCEPELDHSMGAAAAAALAKADATVVLTPFLSEAMKAYATVLLPVAAFGETSGTFVNAEGRWQSFAAATAAPGEARPAWKVLRVLGNLTGVAGFDHTSSEEVRDELRALVGASAPSARYAATRAVELPPAESGLRLTVETPLYAADPLVRRAEPLQRTADARRGGSLRLSPATAAGLGIEQGAAVAVRLGTAEARLAASVEEGVAEGLLVVPRGVAASSSLLAAHAAGAREPVVRRG